MFIETFFDHCNIAHQSTWPIEEQPPFLRHSYSLAEQQFYCRISPLAISIISIVPGFVYHAFRTLNELAASVLTFQEESFRNIGLHALAAVAHLVALPLLGLWAFAAASKNNELFEKIRWELKKDYAHARTEHFHPITGRIMAPIRGIVQSIESISMAIFSLCILPFSLPATRQRKIELLFAASCHTVAAVFSPFFGMAAIFSKNAREFLGIRKFEILKDWYAN